MAHEEKQIEFALYGGTVTLKNDRYKYFLNEGRARGLKFKAVGRTFANSDEGYTAALDFQRNKSDEVGLTRKFTFSLLTPEKEAYLAGFFDGDGCIQVLDGGLVMHVAQSSSDDKEPPVLIEFQRYFGGVVCLAAKRTNVQRAQFSWRVNGELGMRLVRIVAARGVVKRPQAELVIKAIQQRGHPNLKIRLNDPKSVQKQIKKMKHEYGQVPIIQSRINTAWLAGFFDADGCVMWDHTPEVQWTKKKCKQLIKSIRKTVNSGSITKDKRSVLLCGEDATTWMIKMRPHLFVKGEQIDMIRDHQAFVKSTIHDHSPEAILARKEAEEILKVHLGIMKHGECEVHDRRPKRKRSEKSASKDDDQNERPKKRSKK